MISIVLLGYGNVGMNLCHAFSHHDTLTVTVYNRSAIKKNSRINGVSYIDDIQELPRADVYIIAISDDSIGRFSEELPLDNQLVVHTSGAVDMEVLSNKNRRGIFYPLQTFSELRTPPFKEIPICIEAENKADQTLLESLGHCISDNVYEISSLERQKIHIAAVFVNNFTNHMYQIAEDYLQQQQLEFNLLKPLIRETSEKIQHVSPTQMQTGPAVRNDEMTLQKHYDLLKDSPYQKLYKTLTKSIIETHGKKL
ncbi:MAG: DUF2520 domain-containing protein [Bacteroidetes bacterium]|nr:DUF2520 domain-containing protein [Bacteroidota bacterium]